MQLKYAASKTSIQFPFKSKLLNLRKSYKRNGRIHAKFTPPENVLNSDVF